MQQNTFVLKSWQIYFVVILGTIFRFIYGIITKPWLSAPDQLAWELSLSDALRNDDISYKTLIHYPHEGGSLIMSLIAICMRPLDFIMPSLSLAALMVDSVARLIQIKLSQRMFGSATAGWFAAWTILSAPLLIPWATINFGLHAISSFLPFVFLYFVTSYKSKYPTPVIAGIVAGLSISFSYNNIIFIPAFLIFTFVEKENVKKKLLSVLQFLFFVIIALIPHLFARLFLDNGFAWQQYSFFTIRGVFIETFFTSKHVWNFVYVWHHALPASVLLSSIDFITHHLQRDIIFCFLMIGAILLFLKNPVQKKILYFSSLLIVIYILIYAFSPFYAYGINDKSYLYYRHLAYIMPLIIIMLMYAFLNAKKLSLYLINLWIIICGLGTIMHFISTKPTHQPAYRAAGWVIVQKYGDDINKLKEIYQDSPIEQQNEIMVGYGWGLTSAMLYKKNESDSLTIYQLQHVIHQFPEDQQRLLVLGVHHAFRKEITPILDPELLLIFNKVTRIKM